MQPQYYLTTKEVSVLFGVSTATVRRWAKLGLLTAVRPAIGRQLLFPRDQAAIISQMNRKAIARDQEVLD